MGKENIIGICRNPGKASNLGIETRQGDYDMYDQYSKSLYGIGVLLLVSGNTEPVARIQQHLRQLLKF